MGLLRLDHALTMSNLRQAYGLPGRYFLSLGRMVGCKVVMMN